MRLIGIMHNIYSAGKECYLSNMRLIGIMHNIYSAGKNAIYQI